MPKMKTTTKQWGWCGSYTNKGVLFFLLKRLKQDQKLYFIIAFFLIHQMNSFNVSIHDVGYNSKTFLCFRNLESVEAAIWGNTISEEHSYIKNSQNTECFRTWNIDGVQLLKIYISVVQSHSKWMLLLAPGCKFLQSAADVIGFAFT